MISKKDVKKQINKIILSQMCLWTYKYTRCIIKIATYEDVEFIELARQVLDENTSKGQVRDITSQ